MYGKLIFLSALALAQGNILPNPNAVEECDECPPDIHWLLPHEYDCTLFYYCEYGLKWTEPRQCAPGTEFSYALQVCVHPSLANCDLPGPPTDAANSSTTANPDPTVNPDSTVTSNPTINPDSTPNPGSTTEEPCENGTLPNGCPSDFDVHQLLPHESNCSKFYYCAFGELVERDCPRGTHFNPTLQVCDWPGSAGCENTSSEEVEGSGDPDIDSGEALPNECPDDFDVHLLLPHETDCDKFYYCVFGEKVERDCAPGTHFSASLQVCVWPAIAGCENITTTTSPSPDLSTTQEPCDEDERLPNGCPLCPDVHLLLPSPNCSQFYQCVFGELVERDCPRGLHFNPVLQVCDYPANAGCEPIRPPCTPGGGGCGSNTTTPEPTTTTTTLEPITTTTTPEPTTTTTTPEPTTTTTTPEPTTTTTTPEPTTTTTTRTTTTTSAPSSTSTTTTEAPPAETTTVESSSTTDDCDTEPPCDEDARLPNGCPVCPDISLLLPAANCSQFYYCVFGEKEITDCPGGLHFNPVLQVCDQPQNAGCESLPVRPPCTPGGGGCGSNSTTTTTTTPEPTTTTTTPEPTTTTTTPEPTTTTTTPEPTTTTTTTTPEPTTTTTTPEPTTTTTTTTPEPTTTTTTPEPTTTTTTPEPTTTTTTPEPTTTTTTPESTTTTTTPEPTTTTTTTTPEPTTTTTTPEPTTTTTTPEPTTTTTTPEPTTTTTTPEPTTTTTTPEPTTTTTTPEPTTTTTTPEPTTTTTTPEPTTTTTTPEPTTTTTTPEPTTTTTTPEPTTTRTTTTIGLPPGNQKCIEECNPLPWADDDCDKYWICEGQNPVLVTCSEGLHFNPNTLTCDFICNAGCERIEIQSTVESGGIRLYVPWDKTDTLISELINKKN